MIDLPTYFIGTLHTNIKGIMEIKIYVISLYLCHSELCHSIATQLLLANITIEKYITETSIVTGNQFPPDGDLPIQLIMYRSNSAVTS